MIPKRESYKFEIKDIVDFSRPVYGVELASRKLCPSSHQQIAAFIEFNENRFVVRRQYSIW